MLHFHTREETRKIQRVIPKIYTLNMQLLISRSAKENKNQTDSYKTKTKSIAAVDEVHHAGALGNKYFTRLTISSHFKAVFIATVG